VNKFENISSRFIKKLKERGFDRAISVYANHSKNVSCYYITQFYSIDIITTKITYVDGILYSAEGKITQYDLKIFNEVISTY
jgi:hypothetical protein